MRQKGTIGTGVTPLSRGRFVQGLLVAVAVAGVDSRLLPLQAETAQQKPVLLDGKSLYLEIDSKLVVWRQVFFPVNDNLNYR